MTQAPPIFCRPLEDADTPALLGLRRDNREYFQPSEPLRDDSYFTLDHQRRLLREAVAAAERGDALTFGVFLDERLVGRVALTSIVRGAFCNAYLGYGVDRRFAGRGIATAALRWAVSQAWEGGLHRVQAAVSPDNAASQRVLSKVGFRREGLALRYLRLAGAWADQELWAITTEDPLPERR